MGYTTSYWQNERWSLPVADMLTSYGLCWNPSLGTGMQSGASEWNASVPRPLHLSVLPRSISSFRWATPVMLGSNWMHGGPTGVQNSVRNITQRTPDKVSSGATGVRGTGLASSVTQAPLGKLGAVARVGRPTQGRHGPPTRTQRVGHGAQPRQRHLARRHAAVLLGRATLRAHAQSAEVDS